MRIIDVSTAIESQRQIRQQSMEEALKPVEHAQEKVQEKKKSAKKV